MLLEICLEYIPVMKIRGGKPKILNSLRREKRETYEVNLSIEEYKCGSDT